MAFTATNNELGSFFASHFLLSLEEAAGGRSKAAEK